MSQEGLYFERAAGRWLRYGWPVLAGIFVFTVVVVVLLDHHWGLLFSAAGVLLSGCGAWVNARTRTVVTRDQIVVERGFRRRHLPTSQIAAVTQHTAWSPVAVRLLSGETIALPRVEAHDLGAITHLIQKDEPS